MLYRQIIWFQNSVHQCLQICRDGNFLILLFQNSASYVHSTNLFSFSCQAPQVQIKRTNQNTCLYLIPPEMLDSGDNSDTALSTHLSLCGQGLRFTILISLKSIYSCFICELSKTSNSLQSKPLLKEELMTVHLLKDKINNSSNVQEWKWLHQRQIQIKFQNFLLRIN